MQNNRNLFSMNKKFVLSISKSLLCTFLVIVFLVCNVPLSLASQNNPSSLRGTITVMGSESANVMKPYHSAFMKKYPNVTIKYECLDNYEATITKMVEERDFGDVIYMPSYVDAKTMAECFAPLGLYTELDKVYKFMDKAGRIGNSIYSIPSSAYLAGIVYNKEVFYKAGISVLPTSIDEFYNDMELIKASTDAIPICSNYGFDWALLNWCHFPYIEMTGNAYYKSGTFLYEDNPFSPGSNHYNVYGLLYNLIKNGLSEQPAGSLDWNMALKKLNEGKLACVPIGSWAIHHFKEAGDNPDAIGFMPFPNQIDNKQYATILTDYSYGVNNSSKHVEIAKAYVHFMLSESGYAVEQERISISKTDLLLESYANFDDIICLSTGAYSDQNYFYYDTMKKAVDPDSVDEIKHLIKSAMGIIPEDFDTIMLDWNNRWENARPANLDIQYNAPDNPENVLVPISDSEVSFSASELTYIKNHPTLRVGYLKQLAPIQFEDNDGNLSGLSALILEKISEATNIGYTYYPFNNTKDMIQALNNHEIDLACGIPKTNEYKHIVKFSKSYLTYSDVIILPETIDYAQLNTNNQVVISGEPDVTDYLQATNIIEVNDFSEMLKKVKSSDADFAVSNCYSADYYVHKLYNRSLSTLPLAGEIDMCIAFPNDMQYQLISICNKTICELSNSTIQLALLDYMNTESNITLRRIIETYPLQCVTFLVFLFIFFITTFIIIRIDQVKIAASHASIIKRYATLSKLLDEYIFDYNLLNHSIHLDLKFDKLCGINGLIDIDNNKISNPLIRIISDTCKQCADNKQSMFVSEPFLYTDIKNNTYWYRITLCHIVEKGINQQNYLIGKLTNVQQEIEAQLSMQDLAQRDSLTNLNNRIGFEKKFTEFSQNFCADQGISFAILDLDDFKKVNDLFGHHGGDEALKLLADEIALLQNQNMISARFGGDEFIICIFGTSKGNAELLFQKLVRSMNREFYYNENQIHLSISLGAVYAEECLSYPELLRLADKVLYHVKRTGKNRCEIVEKGILENE